MAKAKPEGLTPVALFNKILVPVDFSAHSVRAVHYAAELSKTYTAPVTLLHAYQTLNYALPEGYVFYSPEQLAELSRALDEQMAQTRAIAERAGALDVDTKMLMGSAHAEILRVAEEEKFDLIVMGTHGRTGLGHAFMGSVAERVVRQAPCPVLTVRSNA
jgi:nucleotide-binding universal stress UspA family protein